MRRHNRRLRLLQRRYARKGRRKAPPDRPPGGKKLRLPRQQPRTYNFNTFPPTGAAITHSEYTLYILTTIHALIDKSLPRIIEHKNYLRQQRKLYYQEIGLRYKNTLPKHASKLKRKLSPQAQLLSDQIQHQLSEHISPTIIDTPSLPSDPTTWSNTLPTPPHDNTQLHSLPSPLPVTYHPFATHMVFTVMVRACIKILTSQRSAPRQPLFTNSNAPTALKSLLFLIGLFLVITSCDKKVSSPIYHNINFQDQNFNFNCNATNHSSTLHMPTSSSAVALPICPPWKQQPGHIVRGLPTPAFLSSGEDAADSNAHVHNTTTLHFTATKNNADLCQRSTIDHGKQAHSL